MVFYKRRKGIKVMEDNKFEKVLFGYSYTSAYGRRGGDYGEFSIEITSSGNLVYRKYRFGEIEIAKKNFYLSKEALNKIKAIILNYQSDIDSFETHLDNGSCDGNGNFFIFNEKEYITWNISYSDENKVKERNPKYYEKYLPVIRQENMMLIIFGKISEVLEREGFFLTLRRFRYQGIIARLIHYLCT